MRKRKMRHRPCRESETLRRKHRLAAALSRNDHGGEKDHEFVSLEEETDSVEGDTVTRVEQETISAFMVRLKVRVRFTFRLKVRSGRCRMYQFSAAALR